MSLYRFEAALKNGNSLVGHIRCVHIETAETVARGIVEMSCRMQRAKGGWHTIMVTSVPDLGSGKDIVTIGDALRYVNRQ